MSEPQYIGGSLDADAVKEWAGEAGCIAVLHALGVDTDAGRRRGDNLDGLRLPPALVNDTNASFSVNSREWTCHDFGGHFDGTLFQLVEAARDCSFPEAVGWVADVCGVSGQVSSTAASVRPAPPPVRPPEPMAAPEPTFWTAERRRLLRAAQDRLTPDHPLARMAAVRDGLTVETLQAFGCGVWSEHGREWLVLPYPSGAQLYRREGGEKRLLSVAGSKPRDSFFGATRMQPGGAAAHLVIAKSPREAMLVAQTRPETAVIGLPGGEKRELSDVQACFLLGLASVLPNVRRVSVSLDCDTPDAERTARSFAASVASAVEGTEAGAVAIGLVNVYARTGGEHKDLADVARAGGSVPETLANAEPVEPAAGTQEDISTETVEAVPALPERAYRKLPEALREACAYFSMWHERDVFLTALLGTLSALLPKVRFQYGETPKYYSLHLMFFLLARAAGGKGAASFAFRWAADVDRALGEESRLRREEWERRRDEYERAKRSKSANPLTVEPPGLEPMATFVEAGDELTLAGLYDALLANPEDGVAILTTEGDALSGSNKREHGGFSYVIRKTFHHERIRESRRGTGRRSVDDPRLAIVATGTPDQYTRLLDSVEDGMYSRFGVYAFESPLDYRSQRPRPGTRNVKAFTAARAADAARLWRTLRGRDRPLYFDVSAPLWDRIDEAFERLNRALYDRPGVSPYLSATVRRGALIAFRIAGVLAMWRAFENGVELGTAQHVAASEEDVEAAVLLATTYAEHALRQAAELGGNRAAEANAGGAHRMTGKQRRCLDALPDPFGLPEIEAAADSVGVNRSTVYRWIEKWIGAGLVEREEHGTHRKQAAAKTAKTAKGSNSTPSSEADSGFSQHSQDSHSRSPDGLTPASGDGATRPFERPPADPTEPWEPWEGEDLLDGDDTAPF